MMMKRRGNIVMWIGVMAVAGLAGSAAAQPVPGAPALPQQYLSKRIAHANRLIQDLEQQLAKAAEGRELLLAEQNLWKITARLLERGQVEGERGAAAALYGLTLWRHADQLGPTVRPQFVDARQALDRNDRAALGRLNVIAEALHSFNARCEQPPKDLIHPTAIDHYLSHTLGPLAAVAKTQSQAEPTDTWTSHRWQEPGNDLSAALEALGQRINVSTALSDPARKRLQKTLGMMQRGREMGALRSRVIGLHQQLQRLLDAAEKLRDAKGLAEQTRPALARRIAEAAEMIADPAQRQYAMARLTQLERDALRFDRLQRLGEDDLNVEPAYRLMGWIIEQEQAAGENTHAHQSLLDSLCRAALDYRRIEQRVLPLEIRRVFVALGRQYDRLETTTFGALGLLADDPAAVNSPRWTEPVRQMRQMVSQLELLHRIPDWVARVSALNPVAGRGLYKQLRRTAIDLSKPDTAADATAALAEMEKQLALFETLPHEPQLDQADSPIMHIVGAQGEAIKQQIILQRTQWAAAWGSGEDPTIAGNDLMLLRRLLLTLNEGEQLGAAKSALRQLNRWAAWEINPEQIGPMTAWLPGALKSAASAAAEGKWQTLEQSLDQIEHRIRVPRLMMMLYRGIGPGIREAPGGLSGMLGQCVYPPPPGAFGADHRMELAQLCAYLEASADAQRREDQAAADALWQHCGDLADRILKQWQTAPPQPLRRTTPPPAQPPTPSVDV